MISDNQFTIPADFLRVSFKTTKNSDSGESYSQLEFTIDADTGENISFKKGRLSGKGIYIELRPIRAEWGENKYWTKDDPILKSKKERCEKSSIEGSSYTSCKLVSDQSLAGGAFINYSVLDSADNENISYIRCFNRKSNDAYGYVCVGNTVLIENVQSEYQYELNNLDDLRKITEINHSVRGLIQKMHNN